MTPLPEITGSIRPLVTTVFAGDEAIIVVDGEVDIANAEALRQALHEACGGFHQKVVLDAARLEFIDASGVGVIIGARRRLALAGRQLVVRTPTSPIRRVLELLGLTDLMEGDRR